jgi:hypothetical protein
MESELKSILSTSVMGEARAGEMGFRFPFGFGFGLFSRGGGGECVRADMWLGESESKSLVVVD